MIKGLSVILCYLNTVKLLYLECGKNDGNTVGCGKLEVIITVAVILW